MRTYSYNCRDKNGALQRGTIQANDRAEVLSQIKAMDCVPLTVTEGKVLQQQSASGLRLFGISGWILALAAVATVAIIGVLFLTMQPKEPKGVSQQSQVKSKKAPPKQVAKKQDSKPAAISSPQVAKPQQETVGAPIERPANQADEMIPGKVEPENKLAEPKTPEPIHFATMSEQMLALISSVPPGVTIPPLPDLSYWDMNEDLKKTATNILVITDQDDEKLAATKEKVAWSKLDVINLTKEGYTGSEILNALHQEHNEKAELRFQISTQLNAEVTQGGDINNILTTLPEINKTLQEQDLPDIKPGEIGITTDDEK